MLLLLCWKNHAPPRGTDCNVERETLGLRPLVVGGEAAREPHALLVEEDRVLGDLLREETLRERGHEDDVEREAAHLLRAADEDLPVAPRVRLDRELGEARLEREPNFVETHWPDVTHRVQLCEEREDARRPPERTRRERGEPLDPLPPRRLDGELGQLGEQGQAVRTERANVGRHAIELRGARAH